MEIPKIGFTVEAGAQEYPSEGPEDPHLLRKPLSYCDSPCGETRREEAPEDRESNPMRISSKGLVGPYVSEDNDRWEVPYPESLASSLIYGDTIENNLIEMSPHLSEDSVMVPINGCRTNRWRLKGMHDGSQIIPKSQRSSTNLKEDDTILLTSSASLLTDDGERLHEPVKARVQYHRRKRLEWRLQNSQPLSPDSKLRDSVNSWTVYDDLLEELEDSLETAARWREQSGQVDASDSVNGLGFSHPNELYQIIESYLQQKLRDFEYQSQLCQQNNPTIPVKAYSEIATMTEVEGKEEEDESAYAMRAHCLPTCQCVPKRSKTKR
ncbi:unnamed protein product [Dicrocoelium dendriticum]|nr:unnamed protein product [Dicrocoelium dendriticum]